LQAIRPALPANLRDRNSQKRPKGLRTERGQVTVDRGLGRGVDRVAFHKDELRAKVLRIRGQQEPLQRPAVLFGGLLPGKRGGYLDPKIFLGGRGSHGQRQRLQVGRRELPLRAAQHTWSVPRSGHS
jgi:hypothetical protein